MQILFFRHSMTAGNFERRYLGCKTDIIPIAGAGICQPDATLPRNSIHLISQSEAANSSRFTGMRLWNV